MFIMICAFWRLIPFQWALPPTKHRFPNGLVTFLGPADRLISWGVGMYSETRVRLQALLGTNFSKQVSLWWRLPSQSSPMSAPFLVRFVPIRVLDTRCVNSTASVAWLAVASLSLDSYVHLSHCMKADLIWDLWCICSRMLLAYLKLELNFSSWLLLSSLFLASLDKSSLSPIWQGFFKIALQSIFLISWANMCLSDPA